FSSQAESAESAKSANSTGIINRRTCMGGTLPRYPAGYGAQEVKIAFRCVKGLLARPCGLNAKSRCRGPVAVAPPAGAGGKSIRERRIRARTRRSEPL